MGQFRQPKETDVDKIIETIGGSNALATQYPQPDVRHDEVYTAEGDMRPHWQYLLDSLQALGPEAIEERYDKARKLLKDDGATFKIYNEPEGSQTWRLNPIPLMIPSEEWSEIEGALLERAELLNLMLEDIYGPQQLIKHGVIPPELLYSHPGFLRACHGIRVPGSKQLILHAADMLRAPDGTMKVVADRTQAPSGAGYALENRTVMTRVMPSLFRDSHVHRLAQFFYQLRTMLNRLNPNSGAPRVVILTPGSFNESYFEHSYLANYLGFPLVQGGDLVVRNGYVWLKSLEGLKRVDVILRRVDDVYCDPVELRGDSHLGVPGILEVARCGNVAIANPLGSGVLENPALYRYLPEIGKYFLGREPRLQTAKTWWCGHPDDLQYVLDHLSELIIKPCYRKSGTFSVYGPELDQNQLQALAEKIKANPLKYVAQEYILGAYSPTWHNGLVVPRPSVLRTYAVSDESSYKIMPGGLTRVSLDDQARKVSNQDGSISKDTWVLASEPEKSIPARSTTEEDQDFGERVELSSRVAENMFWMGRYADRAEASMRLLRVVFVQISKVEPLSPNCQQTLLKAVSHLTLTYPGFTANNSELFQSPLDELFDVITNRTRSGSVAYSLMSLVNSAEQVKEQLSSDTQRIINTIGDELELLDNTLKPGGWSAPEEALDSLVTTLLALSGLVQESMVRSYGWHFINMGRRLERALQTLYLVRSLLVHKLDENDEETLMETALLCSETLITYRRRHRERPEITPGLELLLFDSNNPRSLMYQLHQLNEHFTQLPGFHRQSQLPLHAKKILEATTALQLSDLSALSDDTNGHIRTELDQLLSRLQHLLTTGAVALTDRYFDHKEDQQLLLNDGSWQEEL